MITKSNTNSIPRCFLDHDNLIKGEMKLIVKLNSQLTQYLRMNFFLKKVKLVRPANQVNQLNL
jgi:hypothetical protein